MDLSSPVLQSLLESLNDGVYLVDTEGVVFLWNRGAARITGWGEEDMLGRPCSTALSHVDPEGCVLCEGQCPLEACMEDGGRREATVLLRHREGHRVQVSVRAFPIRDADGGLLGAAQVFRPMGTGTGFYTRSSDHSRFTDALTDLPDRAFLEMTLAMQQTRLRWYQGTFGALLVEVDRYQDLLTAGLEGHVLGTVGRTLLGAVREEDVVGRWGDDVFLVVAPGLDEANLPAVARRLQRIAASCDTGASPVTVSVGAVLVGVGDRLEDRLEEASRLLTLAREERTARGPG